VSGYKPGRLARGRPQLLLAWGIIRRRRAEALLGVLIAAAATAMLTAGVVAQQAQGASLSQEVSRHGAPALIATTLPGDAARAAAAVAAVPGVTRTGPLLPEANGAVRSGHGNVPAVLVQAGTSLPAWLDVLSGRAPVAGQPGVVVERGAAAALDVRAGQTVTVAGPAGIVRATVTAIAGDLSRPSYPLDASAAVYVSAAVARATGVASAAQNTLFGVWLRPGTSPTAVSRAFLAAIPGGHAAGLAGIQNASQTVSFITGISTGTVVAFGLAALACLVIFSLGAARVEVLRRQRWIGELRAIGCTERLVRAALMAAALPAPAVGALAGAFAGAFGGRLLAGQLSQMYGARPATPGLAVTTAGAWLLVMAVTAAATWAATRGISARRPASLLDGLPETGRRSAAGLGGQRGGAAARVSLAFAASRRARTIATVGIVTAATAAAVFAGVVAATAAHLTSDPAEWGFGYSLRVDLPSGVTATAASQRLTRLSGVAAAVPAIEGNVQFSGTPGTIPFVLLPVSQTVETPSLISGRMPRAANEIALGSGAASILGAHTGTVLRLSPAGAPLTVTGITRELSNQGDLMRGTLGLAPTLAGQVSDQAVLVRVANGTSATALAARIEQASGNRWAVTSVLSDISLPFQATLRIGLGLLVLALLALAAAMAARTALVTSEENLPSYGVLKAVGAGRRTLAAIALRYTALLVVPGVAVGAGLGVLLARAGIAAIGVSFGGLTADVSPLLVLIAIVLGAIAPAAGIAAPVLRAERRAPVSSLVARI
jgi:putative ABC transport system permease protein